MLLMCLDKLNMFNLLIFKLLYCFFATDLTILVLVYDKLVWKMGKPKKSVVWKFFEQRADGKGFVSSCNMCTFEVKVPDRSNYWKWFGNSSISWHKNSSIGIGWNLRIHPSLNEILLNITLCIESERELNRYYSIYKSKTPKNVCVSKLLHFSYLTRDNFLECWLHDAAFFNTWIQINDSENTYVPTLYFAFESRRFYGWSRPSVLK